MPDCVAQHEDRVFLTRILRLIDRGEQFRPIAHGDLIFLLGVVSPHVVKALGMKRSCEEYGQKAP